MSKKDRELWMLRNGGLLLEKRISYFDDKYSNPIRNLSDKELQKAIENCKENLTFGRDGLDFTWYKGSLEGLVISLKYRETAHLPLKLTPSNYPSWRAQFNSPLFGRDLQDFVNDTFICPEPTILLNGASTPYIARVLWLRQDQLILHVVLSSLSETVIQSSYAQLLSHCYSNVTQRCSITKLQ
ncbi:hypothetical protein CK203_103455 [Vitis vinifera]|uniref:Uncharacterized protein n=1 Tax=Vitis vinifera TaxID=29760 RepID=A0A438BLA3_VITVI|nr:hypothetical protein CK203_103455 [Vitis vinifera]